MRLITAHRILIGSAIAFFFFYAGWRLRHYVVDAGTAADLMHAAASAVIAVGLIVYYRTLRGWGRR